MKSVVACAFGTEANAQSRLSLAGERELDLDDERVLAFGSALLAIERQPAVLAREREVHHLLTLGLAAGSTAHDLRNLLSVALLETTQLASLSGSERAYVAARLRATLDDARALSERFLVADPAAVARGIDLAPLLRDVVARAHELAEATFEARATVVLEAPESLRVLGQRELLARVLSNLIGNALRASPAGSRVHVRAEQSVDDVRVAIDDFGRGVERAALARLIEPGESAAGGSGYGMSSVRACLAQLGIELRIATRLGRGTRCELVLQRAPRDGSVALLLVDFDRDAGVQWRRALEPAGWEVVTAANALEALRIVRGLELRGALVPRALPGGGRRSLAETCRARGVRMLDTGVQSSWPRFPGPGAATRLARELEQTDAPTS